MRTSTINNLLLAILVFVILGYIGVLKTEELDSYLSIDNTYLVLLWALAISILSFWVQKIEYRYNRIYRDANIPLEVKKKKLVKNAVLTSINTSFSMAFLFYYLGNRSITSFSLIVLLITTIITVFISIYKGKENIKYKN